MTLSQWTADSESSSQPSKSPSAYTLEGPDVRIFVAEATKLRSKVQEAESSSLEWHGKSVELESALHEVSSS